MNVLQCGIMRCPAVLVPLACVFAVGCASIEPEVYRGNQLRTDVIRRDETRGLDAELAPAETSPRELAVRVRHHVIASIHERAVYEKVLLYAEEEDLNRDHHQYVTVPDETILGNVTVRTQTEDRGALAGAQLRVNGHTTTTDDAGIARCPLTGVLRALDDPNVKTVDVSVSHPELGENTFSVTRRDVLRAMGVLYTDTAARTLKQPKMRLNARFPPVASPGETFEASVAVTNQGRNTIHGIRARLFSRHEWLGGRTFTVGDVPPGETREAVRFFSVPTGGIGAVYRSLLGVRHAGGPLEKEQRRITIGVRAP